MEWAYVGEMQEHFVPVPPNQAWRKLTPMGKDVFTPMGWILIHGYKYVRDGEAEEHDGRMYWRVRHCRNKYRPALIRQIGASSLVLNVTISPVVPERVGTFKVTCTCLLYTSDAADE